MVEVGSITFHTDGSYHVNDEYPVNDHKAPGGNPPYRLRELTGLHDKNGKEIYEGDILSFNDGHVVVLVEWDADNATYFADTNGHVTPSMWSRQAEVIGNIYENPELLK